MYCRYLDGREDIDGERTSGLQDIWLAQYGTSDHGFTFSTLEDTLTKRVKVAKKLHMYMCCMDAPPQE